MFSATAARVLRSIAGIVLVSQLVAVSGLTGVAANGLFFFGLVSLLGYAAFEFARLIFIRPAED